MPTALQSLPKLAYQPSGDSRWHNQPEDYAALAGFPFDGWYRIPSDDLDIGISGGDRGSRNESSRNYDRFRQGRRFLVKETSHQPITCNSVQCLPPLPGIASLPIVNTLGQVRLVKNPCKSNRFIGETP